MEGGRESEIQCKNILAAQIVSGVDFKVVTQDRFYEFSAFTEEEAQIWVKLFGIVSLMNKKGVSLFDRNPLLFEALNTPHE